MAGFFSKAPWAPPSSRDDQSSEGKSDDSLTTVLATSEDRSALTILIAECTGAMRQTILGAFDPKYTKDMVQKVSNVGDEKARDTKSDDIEVLKSETAGQDKLAKELAQREKEVNDPKTQDLKNAALQYFDEWSATVIQRVGEVVNSREIYPAHTGPPDKSNESEPVASPMRFVEPPPYNENVSNALLDAYPAIDNSLTSLPESQRALILHSILLLLLSLEHYQAPSRILFLRLATSLRMPIHLCAFHEGKVARSLLTAAENMTADEETKKKAEENLGNRKWKVGLAAVAGAALIGVTGGLAAPLLAAGIGSVMGGLGLGATAAAGYLGTLASSSVLVGGLFGAYGGRMTGKMMDKYAREVEDFAFVPVRSNHKPRKIEKEFRRLRVVVAISGWLTSEKDVYEPWKVIGTQIESFALRFDLEAMMNLGNSMTTMVRSAAWSFAKMEVIKRTVFVSLAAGLWPLSLLKVSRVLDNPFSVASARAVKAGEVLADALINRAQGERPVTLVGYSLGAKVIFTCLQQLAERRAFGLVESVVLIGTPAPSTGLDWRMIRSVVSGRVVNVFSTNDYILAFLYRSHSIQYGVAGLQAIENVKGIENVDVSDLVSGHTSYRYLNGTILNRIGFEDVDADEFAQERAAFKQQESSEEQARAASERAERGNVRHPGSSNTSSMTEGAAGVTDDGPEISDESVRNLEKEIEKKNEQSYINWAQENLMAAGTNTTIAYQKAVNMWRLKRQGPAPQAVASTTSDADNVRGDGLKNLPTANEHACATDDILARSSADEVEATAQQTLPMRLK